MGTLKEYQGITPRGFPNGRLPLSETLAERLFYAEMGHTGMDWSQLSPEFGQEDYRRKVSRMLEGLWDPERPWVVMDLAEDELWRQPSS